MKWFPGLIVAGYGVASGRAENCPFPGGSIRLQQPFFAAAGIDLSQYHLATLNVDLAPHVARPTAVVFDGRLRWHGDLEEHFVLSKIALQVDGQRYAGLWYYPDPATKVDHFQRPSVVELLLPWIEGLSTGTPVEVGFFEEARMHTESVATIDELGQVLADTAFLKPYGFIVQSCRAGECTLMVPFKPALERPGGIISGMTIMGAADVAMWLAIMTRCGTAEKWVTTDMKTAFLRSGRESDMFCTARILKLGKKTAYGTAECHDAWGELLAHHVLSYTKVST